MDEDHVQPRSKLRAIFENDPYAVDVVYTRGSEAKTSLPSDDQGFEMIFGTFQEYFSLYLCDSREHTDTRPIFTLKIGNLKPIICAKSRRILFSYNKTRWSLGQSYQGQYNGLMLPITLGTICRDHPLLAISS